MVSVLDIDFPTLLSSSFSDFSPSGSSDSDTIFSSPANASNDFDFQHFNLDAFATIPWEATLTGSDDSYQSPLVHTVVKQESEEEVVAASPPSSPVRVETLTAAPIAVKKEAEYEGVVTRSQRKPRAKRRKVDTHKEVATSVYSGSSEPRLVLSREELLTLTSTQYEAMIAQVRSVRELTAAEKRDVKRQRRLIKNRESAQASRQRKKTYVEELEKRLAELSNENAMLRQTSLIIQNENSMLRAENDYIKGILSSSGLSNLLNRGNFLTEPMQQQQPQKVQPVSTVPQTLPPPHKVSSLKSSGVVLMILLFSFGLMFGNIGFPNAGGAGFAYEEIPEVLPGRVFQRKEYQPVSNAHTFSEVLEAEGSPAKLKERLSGSKKELDLASSFDASFWKPNMTYLMCGDIHQVQPPQEFGTTSESQDISFIIPPSTLGEAHENENMLLAVTCKVTDVVMVPISAM